MGLRKVLVVLALIVVSAALAGNRGCVPVEPEEPAACEYAGQGYDVGESFPAEDGCNTCTCAEGGRVLCTMRACAVTCEWNGATYAVGEWFPMEPGTCDNCYCGDDGAVVCTRIACRGCSYEGAWFDYGETFPAADGCNTCTCLEDGGIACTEMACIDECNSETDWWRRYVATSREACAAVRFACDPNTTPFFNDCGCGCEQSAQCAEWYDCMPSPDGPGCDLEWIRTNCPFSGIAY